MCQLQFSIRGRGEVRLLPTIFDEGSEADVADMFVRPGTSSKENIIPAKLTKENAFGCDGDVV
jgi:hypothetical protein